MTIEERQGYQRWWRERSSRFESRPSDANELGTASTVSNLLRVSKLVSNEAVTVFYSINKFRFPIFPHPIVPELPSQFSPHLRRAFLSFELRLNIPVEEAATYINNMARKVAESGAMLETFTLILWKTYDGNQRAGEIEARTVLQQAMSSGFLETRKAMARANGTLSSVNGPSLSPGWLWRLLDRPVRREGMW
ncbi:hypothetical protein MMC27_001140 [Xylographa pallens]|nr:hypothetical protein [Xylographa pallens]